jgi:hypothetical protein
MTNKLERALVELIKDNRMREDFKEFETPPGYKFFGEESKSFEYSDFHKIIENMKKQK